MPPIPDQPAASGLVRTLGIRYTRLDRDEVSAEMPVGEHLMQPFGYLHGGASLALAETVASVGGVLNVEKSDRVFGIELNANHVRSVTGGTLRATARPLHRGRSTQVWDVRIVDEQERLVCISRCTLAVVKNTE